MLPQETSFSKNFLIWLMGALSGIVIVAIAVFALHKANLLTSLSIDLTSSAVPGAGNEVNVQTPDVSVLPEQIVQTNNQQIVILVPKSMASKEYRDALNDTINHFTEMALTANNELIPALAEMGENYKIKNFGSFFENLSKIKGVNERGYALVSRISDDLKKLAGANQTTADLGAKSLTNTFIEKGETMTESATAVLNSIDKMLSVGVFNPGVFEEMRQANATFNQKVNDFNKISQELLEYIAKRVEETVSRGR